MSAHPSLALSSILNSPTASTPPSSISAVFSGGEFSSQSSLSSLSPSSSPRSPSSKDSPAKNPRRTRKHVSDVVPRAPPALLRQSERKTSFVDSLVETTMQMVQVIWPSSAFVQMRHAQTADRKASRMDLRFFIQEVLRRSKTSYSTLQVALYYLILIRSFLARDNLSHDSEKAFSLQCGRRMFITALILASKYLQDRNFSAAAWSKISGLSTWDLNVNERAFLAAVNWNLHIPAAKFHRWTEIVLHYSPSAQKSLQSPTYSWRDIITKISPDLDNIDMSGDEVANDSGYESDQSPIFGVPDDYPVGQKPNVKGPAPLPTPTLVPSSGPMQTPAASIIAPTPVRRSSCRFLLSETSAGTSRKRPYDTECRSSLRSLSFPACNSQSATGRHVSARTAESVGPAPSRASRSRLASAPLLAAMRDSGFESVQETSTEDCGRAKRNRTVPGISLGE